MHTELVLQLHHILKWIKWFQSCVIAYESPEIPDPRIAFIKLNTDNANPEKLRLFLDYNGKVFFKIY